MNVGITHVMLILGQVILALIPFSLYFPIRYVTKSGMAGWIAVILAALGWYMPAHAVDWGKYPALMSLGLIPFVLSLAYLALNSADLSAKKRIAIYGLLVTSILLTIVTHSRSLIVFGIVFISWIARAWWWKLSNKQKAITFAAVVLITLLEVVFILRQSLLILLFDPYLTKGYLITGLVLFLSVFAWLEHPRLTFVFVFVVMLMLGSLFIPVTFIPGYRDLTLLDRPYVEMFLFLPLSLLGGLGLAGLEKRLQKRIPWGRYVGLLAIGFVIVNASFTYNFYPSDCCVIVGNDDVVAMDWIANQLPVETRIGTSSTQLKVISETSEGDVGADAGIWITPLTGRMTFPLPYNSNFDEQAVWERICELRIGYLYVGEVGYPFDGGKIRLHPEWYKPLFSMSKTGVYEVTGCSN